MKSSLVLIAIAACLMGKANAQNINPQNSNNMKEDQIEANPQDSTVLQKIENGTVKGYKAIESGVVNGYKAIENGVVNGYTKMQDGIVNGYTKLQDTIVAKVFTLPGETVEEAKARMQANAKKQQNN